MCYVSANKGDLCEVPFVFFISRRIACNSRQLGRGLGAWATTAGNTNGDVEALYMAPKILLGICMGASSTSFFTTTAVLCSRHQSIDIRQSSGQSKKMAIPPIPLGHNIFCMRCCVLLLFVAVCFCFTLYLVSFHTSICVPVGEKN